MLISIIAAVDSNFRIGRNGKLPWKPIPEDMKWFRRRTLGKPIIMGRKTFDSIGNALPGRTNIVLTRNNDWSAPDTLVARKQEEALALAKNAEEVVIIGGAEIFSMFLPQADRLYLTHINHIFPGDACFPLFAEQLNRRWNILCERVCHTTVSGKDTKLMFRTYERAV